MIMTVTRACTLTLLSFVLITISQGNLSGRNSTAGSDTQTAGAADPWAACRFLLGDWVAVAGSGKPGEAVSGGFSFAFDLGGKILVRRNRADYAPKAGEKTGLSHQDLLTMYQLLGETQCKAFYIDNEGHEIRYLVTFPKEGLAVFESDSSQKGPRYRLEHQLNADHSMTVTFSMAMPGGEFQVYARGVARRK
jgi:hypothetical protein